MCYGVRLEAENPANRGHSVRPRRPKTTLGCADSKEEHRLYFPDASSLQPIGGVRCLLGYVIPQAALARNPEVDRVHGISPEALESACVGSHAGGTEPAVNDVAPVARAVHPAPEGRVRFPVDARAPGEVLAVDAPVVAEALQALADAIPIVGG